MQIFNGPNGSVGMQRHVETSCMLLLPPLRSAQGAGVEKIFSGNIRSFHNWQSRTGLQSGVVIGECLLGKGTAIHVERMWLDEGLTP